MAVYTFRPKVSGTFVNWIDPMTWTAGVVPNSAYADVVLPLVTSGTGLPYYTTISIAPGESFFTHSIQQAVSEILQIDGTLTVGSDFGSGGGLIFSSNGTLNVGSLEISSSVQGTGRINAGTIVNNSVIDGSISIQANSFTNYGSLSAFDGNATVSVVPGGFANLSASTLTGGSYGAGASGTLSLNAGGVIATDAANIKLQGGTIQSFDPLSGQYVSLTSSLHTIASTGSLTIVGTQSYSFGALTVQGTLMMGNSQDLTGSLGSSQLTVASGGVVEGAGTIAGPLSVSSQGVIRANTVLETLDLQGPVSGGGTLEVSAGRQIMMVNRSGDFTFVTLPCALELGGPVSAAVKFDDGSGKLILDAPATFTGTIAPASTGDVVRLGNTALGSIIGKSYVGDAQGGTLTLQEGGTSIALRFVGNYNVDSFALSDGPPPQLSSDPPSVDVTILCFASGTLIRTVRGDFAVEDLRVGDLAVTASGELRPIVWIGHRDIDCRHLHLAPVRVVAHAFGLGMPARDLFLSPGHPVLVGADEEGNGGHLVPIMCLINGTTIERVAVDRVTYWHVELDQHDILLAEGLPAESYLDWGDRAFFTEGSDHALHNPDFVVPGLAGRRRPVAIEGPIVEAERRRLDAVFAIRLASAAAWPGTEDALAF